MSRFTFAHCNIAEKAINYASIAFGEFSARVQNSARLYASRTYALGEFHPLPLEKQVIIFNRIQYIVLESETNYC